MHSISRRGYEFEFESPIPGLHVYNNIDIDSDLLSSLMNSPELEREDYFIEEEFGKRSQSLWIEDPKRVSILADSFEEVVDSYFVHHNIGPKSRESWRFSKFVPGDFFGVHPDDSFGTPRTASLTYYPNDDYEGGEIEFINFDIKIKPKAKQLFLFPAGYSYLHKVHPITSGTRYNLVTFFSNLTLEEQAARIEKIGRYGAETEIEYLLR